MESNGERNILDPMEWENDGTQIHDEAQEFEEMKKKMEELKGDLFALRTKITHSSKPNQHHPESKQDADSRSIFVGNVHFGCSLDEVKEHFDECGTINRVTILADKFGKPKGYAYVEFEKAEAVQNALLLSGTQLRSRPLKVCGKRTNLPGVALQHRGRSGSVNPYIHNRGYGNGQRFHPYFKYRGRKPANGYNMHGY